MKISVIVPCHNNSHIENVLDSVISQLRSEDEIIVVDDYSDEKTKETLDKMKDRGVLVVHSQKRGNRSANRNLAAGMSRGELLLFLDGDVLLETGALEKIREYDFGSVSGICGSVAAMRMLPETADIYFKSYFDKKSSYPDFDLWHTAFPDAREKSENLPWNRFYTALAVVPREKYLQAGGFDESFEGWGAEDVDIGYRLSKLGKLKTAPHIRAIHIPHKRNILNEEISGRTNMYAMLKKYRNRDMEELLSFALKESASEALSRVIKTLSQLEGESISTPETKGELVFNSISKSHPEGNIVRFDDVGGLISESFIGLALPFDDGYFDSVSATTELFDYPEPLAARILQELLRVSGQVKIKKVPPRSVNWAGIEEKFMHIFCYYKIYLFADSYQDFCIEDKGEFYLVTR